MGLSKLDIVHFAGGVLTAVASVLYPVLGVLMAVLFIVYEVDEDWHLSDMAFRDILYYMLGLYVTAIVLVAATVAGVLAVCPAR